MAALFVYEQGMQKLTSMVQFLLPYRERIALTHDFKKSEQQMSRK